MMMTVQEYRAAVKLVKRIVARVHLREGNAMSGFKVSKAATLQMVRGMPQDAKIRARLLSDTILEIG